VKKDNEEYFLKEEPTKIYYTGPSGTFPSTIALNKLYYFMPYIKGKGVSDLYLIRVARVGTKAEVHPETNDEKPRLVFELEYLESLPRNQWVRLDKDKDFAFKDTLLGRIFKDNQET
jgi:DNA (cytosine-5)-methyltransferase 1